MSLKEDVLNEIEVTAMTYLQLGVAGIPAIIYKRDTLTMQTWERWETPALIMQWLRFRKYITESGGKK